MSRRPTDPSLWNNFESHMGSNVLCCHHAWEGGRQYWVKVPYSASGLNLEWMEFYILYKCKKRKECGAIYRYNTYNVLLQ